MFLPQKVRKEITSVYNYTSEVLAHMHLDRNYVMRKYGMQEFFVRNSIIWKYKIAVERNEQILIINVFLLLQIFF